MCSGRAPPGRCRGMSRCREVVRFQVTAGCAHGSGSGVAPPCEQSERVKGDCHALSLGVIRTEELLAAKGGWEGRERHFGDAKSDMSGGHQSGGVQPTAGRARLVLPPFYS